MILDNRSAQLGNSGCPTITESTFAKPTFCVKTSPVEVRSGCCQVLLKGSLCIIFQRIACIFAFAGVFGKGSFDFHCVFSGQFCFGIIVSGYLYMLAICSTNFLRIIIARSSDIEIVIPVVKTESALRKHYSILIADAIVLARHKMKTKLNLSDSRKSAATFTRPFMSLTPSIIDR